MQFFNCTNRFLSHAPISILWHDKNWGYPFRDIFILFVNDTHCTYRLTIFLNVIIVRKRLPQSRYDFIDIFSCRTGFRVLILLIQITKCFYLHVP